MTEICIMAQERVKVVCMIIEDNSAIKYQIQLSTTEHCRMRAINSCLSLTAYHYVT